MKILVSFQPNKKASDFEGVRLRKTIKGALEMVGIEYTTSIVDKYDVMHLISPDDENKENDAKENDIPVIVSALYCRWPGSGSPAHRRSWPAAASYPWAGSSRRSRTKGCCSGCQCAGRDRCRR